MILSTGRSTRRALRVDIVTMQNAQRLTLEQMRPFAAISGGLGFGV